jgi:hypothetical protein
MTLELRSGVHGEVNCHFLCYASTSYHRWDAAVS